MDKETHLSRALDLLRNGPDDSLPYAALELRFTIEALAYAKLRLYAPRLPEAVLERWQPPQALKALLEFEPLATENHVLRFCEETSPGVASGNWVELGQHRSIKFEWARQSYNKLGSYLHLRSPKSQNRVAQNGEAQAAATREGLLKIARELEPLVSSRLDSSLAAITNLECKACGQLIVRNTQSLRETRKAICQNPNCGAEHHCTEDDDTGGFTGGLGSEQLYVREVRTRDSRAKPLSANWI